MRLLRLSLWVLFALPVIATAQTTSYIAIKVEAENYNSKHSDWHRVSADNQPNVLPDPDGSHHSSASNGAYLELLPDTRVTHSDPLQSGTNFWNTAGTGPSLSYDVNIPEAGRYLVYVKAYSTGTEDNGIHVGLNDSFPASGNRMQWCNGKNQWTWSSAQRTTSNHCGEARTIYLDIPIAGGNTINFTAREDGFEFDQFILLKEANSSILCEPNQNDQISCNQGSGDGFETTPTETTPTETTPTESTPTESTPTESTPTDGTLAECSSTTADPDGDGFGWENNQSCLVVESTIPTEQIQNCSSAQSDPDGDGFGWENNSTCLVTEETGSANGNGTLTCESADSDPDGDGWGWENHQSCLVQ